jgi:hypothetical protein
MKHIHIHIHECDHCKPEHCPAPAPWIATEVFTIQSQLKTKGEITMTSVKVKQTLTATWPGPKDKFGNDASVQDGSISFSSDDSSVAIVEANPDGGPYSVKISSGEKTGATAIRIQADADLGEGVKTIEGVLTLEVLAGEAVAFGDPTVSEAVDLP